MNTNSVPLIKNIKENKINVYVYVDFFARFPLVYYFSGFIIDLYNQLKGKGYDAEDCRQKGC